MSFLVAFITYSLQVAFISCVSQQGLDKAVNVIHSTLPHLRLAHTPHTLVTVCAIVCWRAHFKVIGAQLFVAAWGKDHDHEAVCSDL